MGSKFKEVKKAISDIRIIWKAKIEIVTTEIWNSVKMGDTKMVWVRLSQLKNNKSEPFGDHT